MTTLSIRLRLSLLAAGLVVVTAFTLSFLGSRISRNEFRRVEAVVAVAPGGRIDLERLRAPLLEEARRRNGFSGSAPVLERLRSGSGAGGLVLLSPEGVTLAATPESLLRSRIVVTPDGALRVENGNDVALVRGASLLLEPGGGLAAATLWAVPVPEPEEADGREGDFMRSVNRALLLAALAVALAGAVATFLLVGRGVAPLVALTENARRLARGERAERLDTGRRDEIGRLAEAFDAMSAALERNERLRRDLVSDVAHELRTPLTNLRGQLEALQDGLRTPTREVIDSLHGEALALQRLVEDLQDLSLADAGELRLSRSPTDVAAALQRAATAIEPVYRTAGVTLEVQPGPPLPLVDADPLRLGQVLRNLLENAAAHTPKGGRVTLSARRAAAAAVEIAVSDTGEGIGPEALDRIFERFWRADPSRARATGGTGLGLAIVRSLVAAHGGTVAVESRPGQGSTFRVLWPSSNRHVP